MITVNGKDKIAWYSGITVKDIFDILGYEYSLISVHIEDNYVSPEDYSVTEVPDKANVYAMHLAHGG
jgi:sulfur carrier protein ThiS